MAVLIAVVVLMAVLMAVVVVLMAVLMAVVVVLVFVAVLVVAVGVVDPCAPQGTPAEHKREVFAVFCFWGCGGFFLITHAPNGTF